MLLHIEHRDAKLGNEENTDSPVFNSATLLSAGNFNEFKASLKAELQSPKLSKRSLKDWQINLTKIDLQESISMFVTLIF